MNETLLTSVVVCGWSGHSRVPLGLSGFHASLTGILAFKGGGGGLNTSLVLESAP